MVREPFHLSDQDILLVVDGEVSRRRAKQARAHLAACCLCRSRLGELEGTIADFVSLHRRSRDPQLVDPQLPSATGARALLKARLAEAAAETPTALWPRFLQGVPAAVCLCTALFLTALGSIFLLRHSQPHGSAPANISFASMIVPDHTLTPGATRPVSTGDVCSMAHEEVVRAVPSELRQQVFKEYGIVNPRPEDYEIDYLIAPGLGGAEDIHNLWPQPSSSSTWNARVKDELEERLHQLVCDGQLDLPAAQRAIATDWITAYKKYLRSDRYVSQSNQGFAPHA
jgi:hypothetical protein